MSDGELLRRRNLFVAEGRLVVGRLLESGHASCRVLVNEASFRALEASLSRLPQDVPVYVCDTDEFAVDHRIQPAPRLPRAGASGRRIGRSAM